MKCVIGCLAILFIAIPGMAVEDPYIAIVGNDVDGNAFYFDPVHEPFLFDQNALWVPVCYTGTAPTATQTNLSSLRVGSGAGCEDFLSSTPTDQPEICDVNGTGVSLGAFRGLANAVVRAGTAGFFEWWIRLPKRPSGGINVVIQCGVVGPNAFATYGFNAVKACAAETGERIGAQPCVSDAVDAGVSPVTYTALPRLAVVAYPGPYNVFTPFHLSAIKTSSVYAPAFDAITAVQVNNTNAQILDASRSSRLVLSTCTDMSVVTKLPVTGQLNSCSNAAIPTANPPLPTCFGGDTEVETELDVGDILQVRLDI